MNTGGFGRRIPPSDTDAIPVWVAPARVLGVLAVLVISTPVGFRETEIQGGVKVLGHLGHLGQHVRLAQLAELRGDGYFPAIAELLVRSLSS